MPLPTPLLHLVSTLQKLYHISGGRSSSSQIIFFTTCRDPVLFAFYLIVDLVPVFCFGKHKFYFIFSGFFTLENSNFASILLSSGSVLFIFRKLFYSYHPCYISNFSSTNLHSSSIDFLVSFRFLYLHSSLYHRLLTRSRTVLDSLYSSQFSSSFLILSSPSNGLSLCPFFEKGSCDCFVLNGALTLASILQYRIKDYLAILSRSTDVDEQLRVLE